MPLLSILLNKLLEAEFNCIEEMKIKLRMRFFYTPLQSSSKPMLQWSSVRKLKMLTWRKGMWSGVILTLQFPIQITSTLFPRKTQSGSFRGYKYIQFKKMGEKKSLKWNMKFSTRVCSSYPMLLYIRFAHCSCLSEIQLHNQSKSHLRLIEKEQTEVKWRMKMKNMEKF